MLIRIGYEMIFDMPAPAPMLLLLYTHPSRSASLTQPERLHIEPEVLAHEFTDWFGNHCGRIVAPAGRLRFCYDAIVQDSGQPDVVHENAKQHPVEDLPTEALQFLLGSRYCEVDLLTPIAWNLFGQTPPGWARVQAVCDWVHRHLTFGYEHARPTRTAHEVYQEGVGVCRDFTHLAVTLCRCLNIPARYCNGYLGDIGIPPDPLPMDFNAWFEVFLGGRWYTFDARHNVPRIGRVLIARGRDAADVAMTTSFGAANLEKFTVWTDEVPEPLAGEGSGGLES
jgi:transglutaminase-like putative cysteine protease